MQLFVNDKCLGPVESLADFYPEAKWQRCVVHFYRNVFTAVPKGKIKEVAAMLEAIHAQEDRPAAEEKIQAFTEKVKGYEVGQRGQDSRTGRRSTDQLPTYKQHFADWN